MSVRKTLLALAVPAILAACVETPKAYNVQIPMASRDKIASTEVVVPIAQNEITNYEPGPVAYGTYTPVYYPSTVSPGAAAAGGLIAAVIIAGIDSAVAAGAENEIKPLKASLTDYNFDTTLQAAVKTELANAAWLNAGEPRVVKEVTSKNLDSVITASTASGVLMMRSDYQLSPNADEVLLSISPHFYPKSADLAAQLPEKPTKSGGAGQAANALYRNTFTFKTQAPNATTDRRTNIAIWTANNGEAMRAALNMGATKLAQMFVADLQAPPYAAIDAKATTLASFKQDLVQGYVLRSDDDGQVIGQLSGAQIYVSKISLTPLVAPTAEAKAAANAAIAAATAENPGQPAKMSARDRAAAQKAAEKERRAKAKAAKN